MTFRGSTDTVGQHRRRVLLRSSQVVVAATLVTVLGFAGLPGGAHGAASARARTVPEDSGDLDVLRARAQQDGSTRVIVSLDAGAVPSAAAVERAQAEVEADVEGSGSEVVRELERAAAVAVEATPEGLDALAAAPEVAAIEEDRLLEPALSSTTDDIGAAGPGGAWAQGYDGSGTAVAIVDTGVEAAHPFFGGRVVDEACFTDFACPNGQSTQVGPGAARPCTFSVSCRHGTHVAGIAAGSGGGSTGVGDDNSGVARGAGIVSIQVFSPAGGYVLDGWGGLHRVGAAPPLTPSWYVGGLDLARDVALRDDAASGYVLDGWGGFHRVGGAPALTTGFYTPGWDLSRGMALVGDAHGYVLDAWGGLHRFGAAPAASGGPYWPGWDIARDVALHPGGGGYVLDAWGGIHAFGGAPKMSGGPYWKGWDIARSLVLLPDGSGGYVLDGWGGRHRFGAAPPLPHGPYWPGWNIARGMDVVPEVLAYTSDVVAALEYVDELPAGLGVIAANLSLGAGHHTTTCDSQPGTFAATQAVDSLVVSGIATVAASGNQGYLDAVNFPACLSNAVSVGSTNDAGTAVSLFSNRAAFLDFFAPGQSVTSSVLGGYGSLEGTSMATPHVTGALAVLAQKSTAPEPGTGQLGDLLDALVTTGNPVADENAVFIQLADALAEVS